MNGGCSCLPSGLSRAQCRSRATDCIRHTTHCRATSRGRRCGDFTENSQRTKNNFSSNCCICNSARERDDGLYSAYCPLSSDKQRTQRRRFHGKLPKEPKTIFRQIAAYATLRGSETMGCTRRTAHCRVTSRGRKGGNVSKNSQRTKTIFRQIAAYATLRGSETMGCTRRTAHCRVTSRGRRGGDFTENSPRTKTYFSSDCCIYNSARERDDGLYSAYCPLSSDKQRRRGGDFTENLKRIMKFTTIPNNGKSWNEPLRYAFECGTEVPTDVEIKITNAATGQTIGCKKAIRGNRRRGGHSLLSERIVRPAAAADDKDGVRKGRRRHGRGGHCGCDSAGGRQRRRRRRTDGCKRDGAGAQILPHGVRHVPARRYCRERGRSGRYRPTR